ncbi:unnamed protein product, partial [marine sediment metagenome]
SSFLFGEESWIRTNETFQSNRLADDCYKPLCHFSIGEVDGP